MTGHDVTTAEIAVSDDGNAVARAVAQKLMGLALAKADGPFVIALSGGSTPKRLFQFMAAPEFSEKFPWGRTHIFFADERFVPHTHADSNYRMTRGLLLDKIGHDRPHVHPIPIAETAKKSAQIYQTALQTLYGAKTLQRDRPLFDVVMLGMGNDGHTASLFPGRPILKERLDWVGACTPDEAPHERVSLTYPSIHSSRHVFFMLEGAGKADIFARVRQGDQALPSTHVTSEGGIIFFVDQQAAGGLNRD